MAGIRSSQAESPAVPSMWLRGAYSEARDTLRVRHLCDSSGWQGPLLECGHQLSQSEKLRGMQLIGCCCTESCQHQRVLQHRPLSHTQNSCPSAVGDNQPYLILPPSQLTPPALSLPAVGECALSPPAPTHQVAMVASAQISSSMQG